MTASIPLLAHDDLDTVFAWRDGRAVPVREFLADVERVAAAMPPSRHVLNACTDRYHVAVGFAAAVLSGKVNLLPSTRTADTVRHLLASAPDLFCLVDAACELDLPQMAYPPSGGVDAASAARMPSIAADQQVARVFTSGSTGAPIPHDKNWGSLVHCIRSGQRRLALPPGTTLVGTVPAQHMYGFESTLLMAFHGGVALSAGHPFYPADIAAELARVPEPRLLVSTPVHLRALLAADVAVPPLQLVLCATAPLPAELAHAVESRLGAPLVEIYGSTETGQIATRRTARTDSFSLFDELELVPVGDGVAMASGGHLLAPTPIHDVIEKVSHIDFLLHGRSADMVNVAGKRSSLAHLNHQLCAVPGVLDGAFFAPDAAATETVPRLMAFAVAPGLSAATLRRALRERIDPAFMPRPLVLLDALPRNATGKLPRAALAALAADYVDTTEVERDER